MRLFQIIFIATAIIALTLPLYAEPNPELVKSLNKVLVLEIKSMQQCEAHSDVFTITIPYHQIILEKLDIIHAIADLASALGGDVDKDRLPVEKQALLYQALNRDAYDQITLTGMCDAILEQFGHPEVRRLITSARQQSLRHFMLLSNKAQEIIAETKLSSELRVP